MVAEPSMCIAGAAGMGVWICTASNRRPEVILSFRLMRDFLPDYIAAGRASELFRWTDNAANAGILWCYEHENRGRNRCETSCLRGGGCAIVEDSVVLSVHPAASVSTFKCRDYEAMLAVIPSKKLGMRDVDAVRALVLRFMSTFRDSSVVCFESARTPEGETTWRPFYERVKGARHSP